MEVHLERHTGFLILRVTGDLRLWGRAGTEKNPLAMLRAEPDLPGQLVLSLFGVNHLDTAGISSIVRVVIECTKRQVELKLVLPRGVPGEALRRLHLFDSWPEFPEEAAAIQAAQSAAGG